MAMDGPDREPRGNWPIQCTVGCRKYCLGGGGKKKKKKDGRN